MSDYSIDATALAGRLKQSELVQLTDDADTGAIDEPTLTAAIDAAEAEFHLYAGVYYAIPVRTSAGAVPPGVKEKLLDAVAWRLKQRVPELLRNGDDEGKLWAERRKELLEWYEAIANLDPKKRLVIPGAVAPDSPATEPRTGGVSVDADCELYGEGFMN